MMKINIPLFLTLLALGAPAHAQDCAHAASKTDRAICANPQARAADHSMTQAYNEVRARMNPQQKAALLESQRAFIKRRALYCGEDSDIGGCVSQLTGARGDYLRGAGLATPLVVYEKHGRGEVILEMIKLDPSRPAARALNDKIDQIIADTRARAAEEPGTYLTTATLLRADAALTSARVESYVDTGGAHGLTTVDGLNIGANGAELKFSDFFDAGGRRLLNSFCETQIAAEKEKRLQEKLDARAIEELRTSMVMQLSQLNHWLIQADGAKIIFNPYSIGAYAEGAYECAVSAAQIKSAAKPGAPRIF